MVIDKVCQCGHLDKDHKHNCDGCYECDCLEFEEQSDDLEDKDDFML